MTSITATFTGIFDDEDLRSALEELAEKFPGIDLSLTEDHLEPEVYV